MFFGVKSFLLFVFVQGGKEEIWGVLADGK